MTPPPSLQDLIDTVQRDSASEDPLDLLATAASTVARLEDTGDALLGHFVDRCRRDGRSWSQISTALGVSKQAVHKRFSGALADQIIAARPPTFERFTARARGVLLAASRAAESLGRDSVGSEHLLLGLFSEQGGLAARALTDMRVSQEAVAAAVLAASAADGDGQPADRPVTPGATPGDAPGDTPGGPDGTGSGPAGSANPATPGAGQDSAVRDTVAGGADALGRLRFGDQAKGALRGALTVALELGHNYIGTEHILLGLYRVPDGTAARILGGLGATDSEATTRVSELLRGYARPAS
jgi:ATP-dependent Clp protease ATP-binding subunit ClpA